MSASHVLETARPRAQYIDNFFTWTMPASAPRVLQRKMILESAHAALCVPQSSAGDLPLRP